MSIETKIDHSMKLDKSITEKSIQSYIDSKFCRLNSGHPVIGLLCLHYGHCALTTKAMVQTIFLSGKNLQIKLIKKITI